MRTPVAATSSTAMFTGLGRRATSEKTSSGVRSLILGCPCGHRRAEDAKTNSVQIGRCNQIANPGQIVLLCGSCSPLPHSSYADNVIIALSSEKIDLCCWSLQFRMGL